MTPHGKAARCAAPKSVGQRGTTLVEFAVIVTVFILMVVGAIDFARVLYTYHYVSDAARDATRYAMVRGHSCSGFSDCPDVTQTQIQTYLSNVPAGIDSTRLNVTASWPVQTNSPAACSTASTKESPGCTVQVQVSYSYSFLFPLVHNSTITLSSTSQMVISQ